MTIMRTQGTLVHIYNYTLEIKLSVKEELRKGVIQKCQWRNKSLKHQSRLS